MKTKEFRKTIDQLHERLVKLTETKGEEYKRSEDNQFANFERGAADTGLIREQVLLIYLSKHMDSIKTWIKDLAASKNREYSEPITGRIDDAILYLLLLRGMAEDRAGRATDGAPDPVSYISTDTVERAPDGRPVGHRMCYYCGHVDGHSLECRAPKQPAFAHATVPHNAERHFAEDTFGYCNREDTIWSLQEAVTKWAHDTFGEHRTEAAWKKLFEELGEAIRNPSDPMEWADLFILLLDLASIYGVKDLTAAIYKKMAVNSKRTWERRNGVMVHTKD